MNQLLFNAASAGGVEVDHLIWAMIGISVAVLGLVFGLMFTYVIRYRAGSTIDRGRLAEKSWIFEITWTSATLIVFFGLFLWSADLYLRLYQSPKDAYKIYVVGKQWMWKIEYPDGQREINALHVPVGKPVQLVMTSEDVIHDFAIPAFRVKHDVLPGRYETVWFQASRAGTYHLFCTQFCGTDHAAMGGEVIAMSEPDFTRWLAGTNSDQSLVAAGQSLYRRDGCDGCHDGRSTVRAPDLHGIYDHPVALADGDVTTIDDDFLRNAILYPDRQPPAGYAAVMPSFAGQIGEEDLLKLLAYIKSLSAGSGSP